MEIGSLAELLSAFGTIAALVAASIAARAAIRTNRQQGKQLSLIEDDRQRQQASLVSVWPVEQDGQVIVRIQNGSNLPIYGAIVMYGEYEDESYVRWFWITRQRIVVTGTTDIVAEPHERPFTRLSSAPSIEYRMTAVAFLDSNSRYWARDTFGLLHHVETDNSIHDLPSHEWLRSTDHPELLKLGGRHTGET